MFKKLVGAALLAASGYAVADSLTDSFMYYKCKQLVTERAAQHHRLQSVLGEPLRAGPWYNSTVNITHGGNMATVVIPLKGTQRSSDVTVRAVRKGGLRWTLLYNLAGGDWDVLIMQAVVGMGPGGAPASISLLQLEEPTALAGSAAECPTCPLPKAAPQPPQGGAAGQ